MNNPIAMVPKAPPTTARAAQAEPSAAAPQGATAPNSAKAAKAAKTVEERGSFASALTSADNAEKGAGAELEGGEDVAGPKGHAHGKKKRAAKDGAPEVATPVAIQTLVVTPRKELTVSIELGARTFEPRSDGTNPVPAIELAPAAAGATAPELQGTEAATAEASADIDLAAAVDVARLGLRAGAQAPQPTTTMALLQGAVPTAPETGPTPAAPPAAEARPAPMAAHGDATRAMRPVDDVRLERAIAPIRVADREVAPRRVEVARAGRGASTSAPGDAFALPAPTRAFEIREAPAVATVTNESVKTPEERQRAVAHAANVMTLRRGFAESDAEIAGIGRVHVRAEDGARAMDVRVTVDRAEGVAILRAHESALSAEVSRAAPNASVTVDRDAPAAFQRDSRDAPQRERETPERETPPRDDGKPRVRFVL